MDITLYFPIVGQSFNVLTLLAVGMVGGIVSSSLGIGSGIVVTPALLTLIGIPSFIATTSQMCNAVGVNLMGFLGYWRRRDVDFSLGFYLFLGGVIGVGVEAAISRWIQGGVVTDRMSLINGIVLGVLGTILLMQNLKALLTKVTKVDTRVTMRQWMIYFPWHKIFVRSRTEISIIIPLFLGFCTGLLTALLGGGNTLFIMPLISYLVGRATPVVHGTTLFAGLFITFIVTIVHCFTHSPFDILLVFCLLLGGILGSRLGMMISDLCPRPYLGLIGAIVIYLLSLKSVLQLLGVLPNFLMIKSLVKENIVTIPSGGQQWTLFIADFLQSSPVSYIATGMAVIIIVAALLEKILQRIIDGIYRIYTSQA